MEAAMSQLRGDEYFQACQQLSVRDLSDAGSIQAMYATVWMFENRKAPTSFKDVKAWTLQRVTDYFADSPVEPEEDVAQKSGDDGAPRPADGPMADSDEPADV